MSRIIDNNWVPTPDNVNELPEPLRNYIHNLEAFAGGSTDVLQENASLRIQVRELTSTNLALRNARDRRDAKPQSSGVGGTCGDCKHFDRQKEWPYKMGTCNSESSDRSALMSADKRTMTVKSGQDCPAFESRCIDT